MQLIKMYGMENCRGVYLKMRQEQKCAEAKNRDEREQTKRPKKKRRVADKKLKK